MNIPGLSALGIPVQGGPETLNPSSGSGRHGASWRMVVELGDSIIAKGIYPGGQSGNPLSPAYQNQLDDWSSGNLQELYFPKSIEEMLESSTKVVELLPSRSP
jgi:penicillin amidase